MASVSSVWNHQSDKDLLLAIIEEKGQLKWPNISEQMQAKGYTFTKEACRQHFQKIRKEARSGGSNNSGTSPVHSAPNSRVTKPSTSAKSTPRKSKPMTDSFQTSHGSFSTNNGSFDNSYPDENEEMATPTKRQRTMQPEGQENGRSSPSFNIEGKGGQHKAIGLENDNLYNQEDVLYYAYA